MSPSRCQDIRRSAQIILNGHEYVARQAMVAGEHSPRTATASPRSPTRGPGSDRTCSVAACGCRAASQVVGWWHLQRAPWRLQLSSTSSSAADLLTVSPSISSKTAVTGSSPTDTGCSRCSTRWWIGPGPGWMCPGSATVSRAARRPCCTRRTFPVIEATIETRSYDLTVFKWDFGRLTGRLHQGRTRAEIRGDRAQHRGVTVRRTIQSSPDRDPTAGIADRFQRRLHPPGGLRSARTSRQTSRQVLHAPAATESHRGAAPSPPCSPCATPRSKLYVLGPQANNALPRLRAGAGPRWWRHFGRARSYRSAAQGLAWREPSASQTASRKSLIRRPSASPPSASSGLARRRDAATSMLPGGESGAAVTDSANSLALDHQILATAGRAQRRRGGAVGHQRTQSGRVRATCRPAQKRRNGHLRRPPPSGLAGSSAGWG